MEGFLKGEHAWNLSQGLEWPGGVSARTEGFAPLWSVPCPSFSLHLIPLTPSPGWLGARQRGEQLPGISGASRGRWEPPLPNSFRCSPLFLSSRHVFPASTFPSSLLLSPPLVLLSPPLVLPEGQRDREESGANPAPCRDVHGPGSVRQGPGGL